MVTSMGNMAKKMIVYHYILTYFLIIKGEKLLDKFAKLSQPKGTMYYSKVLIKETPLSCCRWVFNFPLYPLMFYYQYEYLQSDSTSRLSEKYLTLIFVENATHDQAIKDETLKLNP